MRRDVDARGADRRRRAGQARPGAARCGLREASWATTAGIGGGAIASEIGSRRAGKHAKGADAAGIVLGNPGAVGVTSSSLVTMAVKVSFGGQIKDVSEVP